MFEHIKLMIYSFILLMSRSLQLIYNPTPF